MGQLNTQGIGIATFTDGADGRRVRKKVSGATKGEVIRKLRELRAEMDLSQSVPDDGLTVEKSWSVG